jgi:NAD(P)-dependent dehydrogenase (short-subunit alcohol dehydrogenase family)
LAFAQALVQKGCNVLIADIGLRPEAQAFVNSAAEKGGAKVIFQRTDVTDWAQLENTFDYAEKEFGAVPDLVCPGAGIYEPVRILQFLVLDRASILRVQQPSKGFWGDIDSNSRYKVIDVNLIHPIKMTRIAIRRMLRAKKTGTILHVASVAVETVSVITPLYQASKHGIGSFVMGMGALEGLCGIRVLGVAPG